jgi:hypothetical protein
MGRAKRPGKEATPLAEADPPTSEPAPVVDPSDPLAPGYEPATATSAATQHCQQVFYGDVSWRKLRPDGTAGWFAFFTRGFGVLDERTLRIRRSADAAATAESLLLRVPLEKLIVSGSSTHLFHFFFFFFFVSLTLHRRCPTRPTRPD